jgi:hypothetical protein
LRREPHAFCHSASCNFADKNSSSTRTFGNTNDWLVPVSKLLSGLELRVRDETGGLRTMGAQACFTAADVEQVLTRMFDAVGHGKAIERNAVADVVLVRGWCTTGGFRGFGFRTGGGQAALSGSYPSTHSGATRVPTLLSTSR